jgi:hypothetical protein
MSERQRLRNRRPSQTFDVESRGLKFTATVSRFDDGRLAEIFLQNHKPGSQADANARDSAVVCSLALQHGVAVDVIRHALLRDARGVASTPLGAVLDRLANEEAAP